MQARRIARELALLSISQLPGNQTALGEIQLPNVVLSAVRTLTAEAEDVLETAAAELKGGNERLLSSETRTSTVQSARAMVSEAIDLAQTAINRVGRAIELPELIQLANQPEVRAYALELVDATRSKRDRIDELLTQALVDWQLSRLARIDRDILRIAVAEILFLDVADRIAINEAVELAKRYSGDDGHRFINGVLRRVTNQLKAKLGKDS